MAYTTPRTWVASEYPTAAQFNANVRDNVAFLANPPACRVYHNANQSIANNATLAVAFNSERFDTAAMHDTVTNNGRITFPVTGLYLVSLSVVLATATDYRGITAGILLNGTTSIAEAGVMDNYINLYPAVTIATLYKFTAAEYVTAKVWQTNAAAAARNLLAAVGNHTPEFSAVWVGLG
jgi:hypothetical protein